MPKFTVKVSTTYEVSARRKDLAEVKARLHMADDMHENPTYYTNCFDFEATEVLKAKPKAPKTKKV